MTYIILYNLSLNFCHIWLALRMFLAFSFLLWWNPPSICGLLAIGAFCNNRWSNAYSWILKFQFFCCTYYTLWHFFSLFPQWFQVWPSFIFYLKFPLFPTSRYFLTYLFRSLPSIKVSLRFTWCRVNPTVADSLFLVILFVSYITWDKYLKHLEHMSSKVGCPYI